MVADQYAYGVQDTLLTLALAYELSHLPFLVLVFVLYLMDPDCLMMAYIQVPFMLTVRLGSSLDEISFG